MQRVRDIKQALAASFLHPRVISVLAAHNVIFHRKFDLLFVQAAMDVKKFAAEVQKDGGSMMPGVAGEAALAAQTKVNGSEIFRQETSLAAAELQQVSRLKEVLHNQHSGKAPVAMATAGSASGPSVKLADQPPTWSEGRSGVAESAVPSAPRRPSSTNPPAHVMPRSSRSAADVEADELQRVQASIRSFVRAGDAHSTGVVPLPHGNITLSKAEVEAFRSDYGDETSFRGELATSLMQMAALDARLRAQLLAFETTRNTAYNWKPHADALAHLLSKGRTIVDEAMQLSVVAKQRGLQDKATALLESVENIRPRGRAAVEALQSVSSNRE
jgi:hypothetical protein